MSTPGDNTVRTRRSRMSTPGEAKAPQGPTARGMSEADTPMLPMTSFARGGRE